MRRLLTVLCAAFLVGCGDRTTRETNNRAGDEARVRQLLDTWVAHIEAGKYDSLPPMVTPGFRFIMDGQSYATPELMSLLRSFNATDVDITIDSVSTRLRADTAYIDYSGSELYTLDGVPSAARETGRIVAIRDRDTWRFNEWRYDSRPVQ